PDRLLVGRDFLSDRFDPVMARGRTGVEAPEDEGLIHGDVAHDAAGVLDLPHDTQAQLDTPLALDTRAAGGGRGHRTELERDGYVTSVQVGDDLAQLSVRRMIRLVEQLRVELEDLDVTGRGRPGRVLREELIEVLEARVASAADLARHRVERSEPN